MKRTHSWALCLALAAFGCGGGKSGSPDPTLPEGDLPTPGETPDVPTEEPVAGHPKDDLIPRAVLFGNPDRANVQISPDGKHLSWLAASDGVLNVWVAPVDKLAEARPVTADKARPVRMYGWAYDGKHLVYMQDKAGDENFHVYRADVTTGETTDLTAVDGARAMISGLSPDKPGIVAVSMNDRDPTVFDLYHVDLATGERTLKAKNDQNFTSIMLDRKLDVRFASKLGDDGSVIVQAFDKKSKKWKKYDSYPLDDAMSTALRGFDKKGTSYYLSDSRGRDTGAIYKVDAKTKKKKLLVEDAKVDVGELMLHPRDYTPQAAVLNYDIPRWVAIDKKVGKDLEAIAKLDAGFPRISGRTLDDKIWIVEFNSDVASPKYYKWDRDAQQGEFLFSARPQLDEQPLVRMHPVVIPARDGLELVSYLSLPKAADPDGDGKADQATPMVLFVHGGPWARDQWGFNSMHQMLANRGYAVLSVNYRGSTGFGKKFVNASSMQWGKAMHDDLIDAVEWAVTGGVAPRDKVCIMGGSYGGYATLVGLSMTPDVFACGVDLVGPSSIVTLLETIPPYWKPSVAIWKHRVGDHTTEEGKAALLAVSPLTHLDKIKKPLLILQGANDPRVKRSESDQIVAGMQEKKIPVSYVVFPDEGHGFARPENSIAFTAVTEAFLSVHLGGWYQPIEDAELKASTMTIEAGREWLPGLPGPTTQARSDR
jgi:dipeptidyl aminopeptidase/acylaminoacyl peptidase